MLILIITILNENNNVNENLIKNNKFIENNNIMRRRH